MSQAQIGLIGLAVMGQNLARNIARKGCPIAVFNRSGGVTREFIAAHGGEGTFVATFSLSELVASLERPRRIILLIKAGPAVDQVKDELATFLEPGDIVIDGGNSHFEDTRRRAAEFEAKGLHFIGSGVSGGEEGALNGPSLMPGGDREAYKRIEPIWTRIAAQVDDGPCCAWIGEDGAGHYVKMVHNGIEYGDMQLIAEAYDLLSIWGGLGASELAETFDAWNRGPLESFLIEITAKIFKRIDGETGRPLVELVLDKAGQKGTGKWTTQSGLDLGVPVPTLAAAVDARVMSSMKEERVAASGVLPSATDEMADFKAAASQAGLETPREVLIQTVHDALFAAKICSYAQGMALIGAAGRHYKWSLDLAEIARIWKGGCIIRARFLDGIKQAYRRDPDLANLMLDADFRGWIGDALPGWRWAVTSAAQHGIPVPAMSASLNYFDAYRRARLPQNLTQAQRDLFGAHTYERTDRPGAGPVHSEW